MTGRRSVCGVEVRAVTNEARDHLSPSPSSPVVGSARSVDGDRTSLPAAIPEEKTMPSQMLDVDALDRAWDHAVKACELLAQDLPSRSVAAAATSTAWSAAAVLEWRAITSDDHRLVVDLSEPPALGGAPRDPALLHARALEEARRHAEKASAYLEVDAAELARAAAEVSNAWGQLSLLAARINR
jgi:hypothetical protein